MEATDPWDAPLMVSKGYSSLTFLNAAAEAIAEQSKPAYLYCFGDMGPSGEDISRKIERELREMAPNSEIHFQRMAVTPEQVELYGLPTRPTKSTDSRSKKYGQRRSVELDSIPPAILVDMVRDCILRHVDEDAYRRTLEVEAQERETLAWFLDAWDDTTSGADEGNVY